MQKLSAVKIGRVADGTLIKRSRTSRTWFKVITKGDFGVVVTSTKSEFSALVKKSKEVFI